MFSRQIILALAASPSALAYTLTYVGCFSSAGSLTENNTYLYQSDSYCQTACIADNDAPVLGLNNGNTCYCGSEEPPSSAKVDDSQCNVQCAGYGSDMCGGLNTYSVYLTGTENNVGSTSSGTTTSSSSSTTTSATNAESSSATTSEAPTAVTSVGAGKTIVVTESASPTASSSTSPSSGGKSSHTAAIAAGAVVGIVAVAALAGAVVFFIRHRRKRAAEQQYQNSQGSGFMVSTKPVIPAVKRSPSGPDSRFDSEAMAHRRFSDGSIADNEDFSRRILQVTNPDDRA